MGRKRARQRRTDPGQAWQPASIPAAEKHAHQTQSYQPNQTQQQGRAWVQQESQPQARSEPAPYWPDAPANARASS